MYATMTLLLAALGCAPYQATPPDAQPNKGRSFVEEAASPAPRRRPERHAQRDDDGAGRRCCDCCIRRLRTRDERKLNHRSPRDARESFAPRAGRHATDRGERRHAGFGPGRPDAPAAQRRPAGPCQDRQQPRRPRQRADAHSWPCPMPRIADVAGPTDPDHRPNRAATLDSRTEDALVSAMRHERHAMAYYEAITNRFGPSRMTCRLARAEQRHITALERLFDSYGIATPVTLDTAQVPDSLSAALREALRMEDEMVAHYTQLVEETEHPEIRAVFHRLRETSAERHHPALARAMDGGRPRRR